MSKCTVCKLPPKTTQEQHQRVYGYYRHSTKPLALKNRYIWIRHGQSEANLANILISTHIDGVKGFGLTDKGIEQARAAGAVLYSTITQPTSTTPVPITSDITVYPATNNHVNNITFSNFSQIVIVASDFKRTVETAAHIRHGLITCYNQLSAVPKDVTNPQFCPVLTRPELRERFLGVLDRTFVNSENTLWEEYHKTYLNHANLECTYDEVGVESIESVRIRLFNLINDMELIYENRFIVLVSHQDTIEIGLSAFYFNDPEMMKYHNELKIKNCEVRELISPEKVMDEQYTTAIAE